MHGCSAVLSSSQQKRLRWQWFQCTDQRKPWSHMQIQQSASEIALFKACTDITVGNGQKVEFWQDRWVDGKAPKELAPDLYKLAPRKQGTVAQAMAGGRWKRGLHSIRSTQELHQFVHLWTLLRHCQQLTDQQDEFKGRFSSDGKYSTRSVYNMQFQGAFADFKWDHVWKLKTEEKMQVL
jgi:hypothetical protein